MGNLIVVGESSRGNTEKEDGLKELTGKPSRCCTQSSLQNDVQSPKKVVAMVKSNSMKLIYEELNTKECEEKSYKIAKARQRSRQYKQSINMIEDRNVNILT